MFSQCAITVGGDVAVCIVCVLGDVCMSHCPGVAAPQHVGAN